MTASDFQTPNGQTPNWDDLSEAEIDFYLRRGRKLRAQQAGVVFSGLTRWLGELFGERAPARASHHHPIGAAPSRAAH